MHRAQHPKLPDEYPQNAHTYKFISFQNLNTVVARAWYSCSQYVLKPSVTV